MHYVQDLSLWVSLTSLCSLLIDSTRNGSNGDLWLQVDICDTKRHFGIEVPKRACHSPLLAYSIIALASRSLCAISGTDDSKPSTYYSHALQILIPVLGGPIEALNEEVLAAIVILRQYEEMTGKHKQHNKRHKKEKRKPCVANSSSRKPADSDFGVHLSGSSKLLNSMFSLASKGGLGEAASWVVLRQDYWVALVRSQPMSINLDTYRGSSSFTRPEPECLANRAVFLCAQAITYAFQPAAVRDTERYDRLNRELGSWLTSNPWHADPLWVERPHDSSANGSAFPTVWMTHPAHGEFLIDASWPCCGWLLTFTVVVGYQHYSLARMVLQIFNPYLNKPSLETFKRRTESEVSLLAHQRFPGRITDVANAEQKAVLDNFRVLLGLAISNPSVVNAGFTAAHALKACKFPRILHPPKVFVPSWLTAVLKQAACI